MHPIEGTTAVRLENGRWVVWLNIQSWSESSGDTETSGDEHPIENDWRRIADYDTQSQAEVAARWIGRGVNRQAPPPSGF
ncbi:MAG: hypothetical protein AAF958_00595 [Planctomycetota bacterium]